MSMSSDRRVGQAPSVAKNTERRSDFRTADGQPDLQGVWNFGTLTPLERPAALGDKEFHTPEEAAKFEAEQAALRDSPPPPGPGSVGSYNAFWFDRGTTIVKTRRTSLITDPRNGRLPPVTPEGERRRALRLQAARRLPAGPEDLSLADRCIIGITGTPIIPSPYNNFIQIFQSRDHVAVYSEMIHNARIAALDGRPPSGAGIRQYSGHSRARWDGDTLVIETVKFAIERVGQSATAVVGLMWDLAVGHVGAHQDVRLIERFTRLDAETLLYEFTVDDLRTWTQPWSAALTMRRTGERIYEYACHEGNYAMSNMLSNARAADAGATGSAARNL
jgi:hypothetical protein